MVRLNLCFYLKSGLCTLFISFAFLILMFTQEMRYQEFINTLHQENTQLRDGLIKSNNALLKTKVVKRGLDLMHKDHNVSRRAANHKPIEIHAQNDYDNVKHKEEIPQDAPHQDIKPTQKGLVVDPKYVPDLRDWWYFSNISIWKNASQLTFTDNVEPEKNLKEMPGEGGAAIFVDKATLSAEDQALWDRGYKRNDYNEYVSDMISLHRNIPDFRQPQCHNKTYRVDQMPDTSVVICFHNEGWSPLLRLVHSVLNRSPPQLLKEVILVDDFSDFEHLHARLDAYVAQLPKVKLVRTKQREGIIRARIIGGEAASGTVLTYIDSHCECHEGWLEPLLEQLIDRETNVVCPIIGTVEHLTFQVLQPVQFFIGGFDWDMVFNWKPMSPRENQRRGGDEKPYRSPTMAGGLFSIYKKYWNYLGTYDSSYEIWGAENMELSFKTWMCGGSIEFVPCSYISHIFRLHMPYTSGKKSKGDFFKFNNVRLSEVWLDDFKDVYYKTINQVGDFGNITDRLQMRKEKQCKSFQWYLSTVYPEQFIPEYVGQITNKAFGTCLDSDIGHLAPKSDMQLIEMKPCYQTKEVRQQFFVTNFYQIRILHRCLDWGDPIVKMQVCHEQGGYQHFSYDKDQHIRTSIGKCLAVLADGVTLQVEECQPLEPRQIWLGLQRMDKYEQLNMHHTYPEMTFT